MRQQLLQLAPLMATFLSATTEQVALAMTDALTRLKQDAGNGGLSLSISHTCRYSISRADLGVPAPTDSFCL